MAGRRANSAYMLLGQIIGKAGLFVSLMIYSRMYDDFAFGELLFAVSIGLIVLFLSDMGASILVTRKIATGADTDTMLTASLSLRTVLSAVSLCLVAIAVTAAGYSARQTHLVMLVSAGFVIHGYCETAFAVFRAREQMIFEGLVRVFQGFLGIALAMYAHYGGRDVVFAASTYVYREIPALLFAFYVIMFRMKIKPALRRGGFKRVLPLFRVALPLGIMGLLIVAAQRLDSIFIKEFLSDSAIAAYQQCQKLFEALALIVTPTLLPGALFPALCLAVKKGWSEARQRIAWMTELFLVLAFILIITLWGADEHILRAVWGEGFLRGVPAGEVQTAYRIILLTLPAAYLFSMFISTMIAAGRQKNTLPAVLAGLMAEILLFVLLIPHAGIAGAAFAHLCFLGLASFLMAMNLRKKHGPTGFLRGALRPSVAFAPALALHLADPLGRNATTVTAGVVFLALWSAAGGTSILPKLRKKNA